MLSSLLKQRESKQASIDILYLMTRLFFPLAPTLLNENLKIRNSLRHQSLIKITNDFEAFVIFQNWAEKQVIMKQ